jgi:predicted lipase
MHLLKRCEAIRSAACTYVIIWLSPRESWNSFLMKFKAHWISSALIKRLDNHIRLHQVAMKLQPTTGNTVMKSRKATSWGAIIIYKD